MKQLEEIKARASAATAGPWKADRGGDFQAIRMNAGSLWIDIVDGSWQSLPHGEWIDSPDIDFIESARTDVPRLVAALEATLAWCDLLQYPTTDYPEGFSLQDYALDDAARRVRAAITEALEAA